MAPRSSNSKQNILPLHNMRSTRWSRSTAPRTIANTLGPYDEAVRQISSAYNIANLMEQVHPQEAFRNTATAMLSTANAAKTALALNPAVYRALLHLDLSGADAATRYYMQRQLLEFRSLASIAMMPRARS
jgi:Zn-dependent oligopeptidase